MKAFKYISMVLVLLANLVFAQPSFADAPKFTKNPDYIELTKEIKKLQTAKDSQAQLEGSTPEQIENKLHVLEFQKYAFESGINWSQCQNQTGHTLAVYGPNPNEEEDDDSSSGAALYFLADGQITENEWDCQGVYLPNDVKSNTLTPDGQNQVLTGGVAVKIPKGTKLVVRTNQDTGAVEFNIPVIQVLKPGELKWFIPNVPQAVVDTRVTNAPTNNS